MSAYRRVVYAPAGFSARNFILADLHREVHNGMEFLHGFTTHGEPVYLHRQDVRSVTDLNGEPVYVVRACPVTDLPSGSPSARVVVSPPK